MRFVFFDSFVFASSFAIDVIILLRVSQGLKKSEARRVAREVTPREAAKGTGEPSRAVEAGAPKEPAGDGAQGTMEPAPTHSPPRLILRLS